MSQFLVGQGHRGYQSQFHRRPKDAHSWWWTPERDAKLRYVMEKYDDFEKAARVLGIGTRSARWRWNSIKDQPPTPGEAA